MPREKETPFCLDRCKLGTSHCELHSWSPGNLDVKCAAAAASVLTAQPDRVQEFRLTETEALNYSKSQKMQSSCVRVEAGDTEMVVGEKKIKMK